MSAANGGFRGQGKNWMFTINNPTDDDDPTVWEKRKFLAYQREVGESGTVHYQGYVQFTSNFRLAALRLLNPRAHWELRQGSHEQALAYVTKDETRSPGEGNGPWILGDPPAQGKRNDLQLAIQDVQAGMSVKDIVDKYGATWARNYRALDAAYYIYHNTKRRKKTVVTVVYGASGTGKSRYAFENYPDAYVVRQPSYQQPVWWCGYRHQRAVIIDDFDGWYPYRSFLQLLDQHPHSVSVKGSPAVEFNSEEIIITSNIAPELWYPTQDKIPLCRRLENVIFISRTGQHEVKRGVVPKPLHTVAYDPDNIAPDGHQPAPSVSQSSSSQDAPDFSLFGGEPLTPFTRALLAPSPLAGRESSDNTDCSSWVGQFSSCPFDYSSEEEAPNRPPPISLEDLDFGATSRLLVSRPN